MKDLIALRQYVWEGPYAQWRSDAPHDPGLCADIRAPWMPSNERLILRACEIIGDPELYLYDDHFPPADPNGRGATYRHIPFAWNATGVPRTLSADCQTPGVARFGIALEAHEDFVDIRMHITNHLKRNLGPIDWACCAIALECPSLADPGQARTFIFDGRQLRSLAELRVGSGMTLINIAGGEGFGPALHKHLPRSTVTAHASVTIVESADGQHCAALGFAQSYSAFGCTGNKCFHADPFFGVIKPGAMKQMHGRLYLTRGDRHVAMHRYQQDFRAGSEAHQSPYDSSA